MNTIVVYTQKDMNDLCAILSRNGYVATAYNIVSSTESTCCGKQWRIDYYDPKEVIANAYDIEDGVVSISGQVEKHYRPFKNCNELIEYWYDFTGVINCSPKLFKPQIWVKSKEYGTDNQITAFDNDNESIGGSCVFIQDMWVNMKELFDNFTFSDDSPCGLEE